MPIAFTAPTRPTPDDTLYQNAVEPLCHLILANDSSLNDFADLLNPQRSYQQAAEGIDDALLGNRNNPKAVTFFTQLKIVHDLYQGKQEQWNQALGALAESTFATLLKNKYKSVPNVVFEREKKIEVKNASGSASTDDKDIDVIAWSDASESGEFLEIKKAITSYIRDTQFSKKLKVMVKFRTQVQIITGRPSFVAVASLFDDKTIAVETLTTILLAFEEPSLPIDILVRSQLSDWQTRNYIE
jgi:hypothetical protein